jgi:hypothetical protein
MKPLPDTKAPIVLRTDFSDDDAWSRLCTLITSPIGRDGFQACVDFVDDASFANITPDALCVSTSGKQGHSFIVVADARTFSEPEQSLLVMDLYDEPGRTFRALPTRIQAIENNLSIANMAFAEFADAAAGDTFRGFPGEKKGTYEVASAPHSAARKMPSPPKTLLGRALVYAYKLLRGRPGA